MQFVLGYQDAADPKNYDDDGKHIDLIYDFSSNTVIINRSSFSALKNTRRTYYSARLEIEDRNGNKRMFQLHDWNSQKASGVPKTISFPAEHEDYHDYS